jgi:prolipoprotein diacylglyceryltransferase
VSADFLPHADGQVFALMLMLEGIARYVLEMIRVEPSVVILHWRGDAYGLSISMILGGAIFVMGVIMWNVLPRPRHPLEGLPAIKFGT